MRLRVSESERKSKRLKSIAKGIKRSLKSIYWIILFRKEWMAVWKGLWGREGGKAG